MQTKELAAAIVIGFIGGVVAAKLLIKPRVVEVEVAIPEWEFPKKGPRVREVNRNPKIYGRREIF